MLYYFFKIEYVLFFESYGYITNTRIKFLIIIETTNQQYHDTEIKIVNILFKFLSKINNFIVNNLFNTLRCSKSFIHLILVVSAIHFIQLDNQLLQSK